MKITVVTPFDSANYGAFLQAYCLKLQLEKLGHTVTHVPTRDEKFVRNLYYRDKPSGWRERLQPALFRKKKEFGKRKLEKFLTDQAVFSVESLEACNSDLYILGSDEIWNVNHASFRNPVFWGYGMSPVISYAASVGNADAATFSRCPEQISGLRSLNVRLVRDQRTSELVETLTGETAPIVCDPTLLVPVSDYGGEYTDSYIQSHDCLLIYSYRLSTEMQRSIRGYAKRHHLKTVGCCFQHDWCDYQCICTPLEFSSLIRQCKAVVTTTFHGTIFSALNHANFVSIPTSPKTDQVLEQLNLSNRLLREDNVSADTLERVLNGQAIDYDAVEQTISNLRAFSLAQLETAIRQAVEEGPRFDERVCTSDRCTGCFACMNACSNQAISCVTDYFGRTLPKIDPSKCIQCGRCKQVCPQLHAPELREPIACYAAQRPIEAVRQESASGGIGAVLTEQFLSSGGTVYGAVAHEGGEVAHKRADTLAEGERFRRSKYVQSYIGVTYQEIRAQLQTEQKVLFIGTPCQVDGLRSYLGRAYDNLWCVDIICHGVPPMQYLREHIKAVSGGRHVSTVTFRGGKEDFWLRLYDADEEFYSGEKFKDLYYYTFLKGTTYRENCYTCPYAQQKRCGDLTIGDFWKLDRSTLQTEQSGNISAIMVNTEKGAAFLESVRPQLTIEQRDYAEAVRGNNQLRRPTKRNKRRARFLSSYWKLQDFDEAVRRSGTLMDIRIVNFKRSKPVRALRKIKRGVAKLIGKGTKKTK